MSTKSIGSSWIVFYVDCNNTTNFDSFGVEYIPEEIKKSICFKNIMTSIYKIQAYNQIKFGYFCIGYIEFKIKDKSLLD